MSKGNEDSIDLTHDNDPRPKPIVHYPEEVAEKPSRPQHTRAESSDLLGSQPSSSIGLDDESDDYDWSGEEDLVNEEANFEKKMGLNGESKRQRWGVRRAIIGLFSSLVGSLFIAGLLITPGILVQFLWYEHDKSEYRRDVKDNVQSWLFWMASNLVISWWLALLVDFVPTIISYFLSAFWGHVSESVKSTLELYGSVKNTFKPVLYAASGWVSWILIFVDIYGLYDMSDHSHSRAHYLDRVYQAVEFIFFLALVICGQRMLSHIFAFRFHRIAYRERIQFVREALSVIERLRQYRPKSQADTRTSAHGGPAGVSEKDHYKFVQYALRHVTDSRRKQTGATMSTEETSEPDTQDNVADLGKRKGKARLSDTPVVNSISGPSTPEATPPPSSAGHFHHHPTSGGMNHENTPTIVHAAKALKQAVLHDARNLRGENGGPGALSWDVSSTREAKRLARNIYNKLKQRNRSYLLPLDFHPVFHDQASAEVAFRVFDKDNNGDTSRAEVKNTIVKVYRERRILSRSMRDVSQALQTLNRILLLLAFVILFFISLSVFRLNFTKSFTSIYSLFVAASFIFKSSASSAFDSIMFIFVTHPFDTGDRCLIREENLVVKKVGLFATVFTRADGTETYYFNSQLFNTFIANFRRSGKTFENLTMQVAWRTPLEKLDALERSLNEWLSTEENRWFEPSTNITLQHIHYQRYLEITIGIGHNGNWQDWGLRLERKTAFHAAVQYYCRQLGIICFETPLPVVLRDDDKLEVPPSPGPSAADATSMSSFNITVDDDISVAAFEMDQQLAAGQEKTEQEPGEIKPTLGFLPPASVRTHLKARKSKARKPALCAAI